MTHALIVDDDADAARMVAAVASAQGLSAACAGTLLDARRQLALQAPDLLLLDLQLPDGNGLALLDEPDLLGHPRLVVMSASPHLPATLQDWPGGAPRHLVKPFSQQQLREALTGGLQGGGPEDAAQGLSPVSPVSRFGLLVGASAPMQAVYHQITQVAPTQFTVLITGESGTGKELVARTLHDRSPRRARPFVAINCGALSPQLAESELFGHERGSFTGAERQHPGFFEQAAGGTLFLDEITEMPPPMQVKLLRVLESGSFMRVGATSTMTADVRVIAASNRDLAQAVAQGMLREDLFWRLDVFPIAMPPLRERRDDIGLIAVHLLEQICLQEGQHRELPAAALSALAAQDWPGNVRELRNLLKRAWVLSAGPRLDPSLLASLLRRSAPEGEQTQGRALADLGGVADAADLGGVAALAARPMAMAAPPVAGESIGADFGEGAEADRHRPLRASPVGWLSLPLGISLAEAERRLVEATLLHLGQHREQAAATLGISLKTLYNRLRSYGAA
jgi:DNA-binding NtrC family response regulator